MNHFFSCIPLQSDLCSSRMLNLASLILADASVWLGVVCTCQGHLCTPYIFILQKVCSGSLSLIPLVTK